MLTELFRALSALLSNLNAPLYLADCVPTGAAFPYLTAAFSAPLSAGETGALTLTLWCCGDSANAERFRLTETLAEVLPARGIRIPLTGGAYTLRLKSGPTFISSREALGAKTVWALRCYPGCPKGEEE